MLPNRVYKMSKRSTNNTNRLTYVKFGKTKTQQNTKDQCDINHIMKKFKSGGTLPLIQKDPIYGDFSEAVDYKESLQIILTAEDQFDGLPSDIRNKFKNDPAKFLEFVNDTKNHKELIDMGLATHVLGDHNMDGVVNVQDQVVPNQENTNNAPEKGAEEKKA